MICSKCSARVLPVAVVDIDGTLGDYHGHFGNFASQYWDTKVPDVPWDGSGEFEDYLGLTKEQYRQAKLAYRQGGTKRWMPAYPGARSFVTSLFSRSEVWITTTRPWLRLDNIDPDTQEWLRRNGIRYNHMIYSEDKYDLLVTMVQPERICAIVEDLPEQYDRAEALGLPVIQRANSHNMALGARRPRRAGLTGCLDYAVSNIKTWKEQHERYD